MADRGSPIPTKWARDYKRAVEVLDQRARAASIASGGAGAGDGAPAATAGAAAPPLPPSEQFDIILRGGRVIDPETNTDAVLNVGIRGGEIAAVTSRALAATPGRTTVLDLPAGTVVAPGFIDTHAHGQNEQCDALQAQDGVTTHLELEFGAWPVADFYAARAAGAGGLQPPRSAPRHLASVV